MESTRTIVITELELEYTLSPGTETSDTALAIFGAANLSLQSCGESHQLPLLLLLAALGEFLFVSLLNV